MNDQKELTAEELSKMTIKEVRDLCDSQKCPKCPLFDDRMRECVLNCVPAGWPIWEADE